MPDIVSPPRSMAGWSWREWLRRNKDSLKTLVAGVFGAMSAWVSSLTLPEVWMPVAAIAVGVASKLALDAVDYWFSTQGGA